MGIDSAVDLSDTVAERAGELTQAHALACADAIHLASALAVQSVGVIVAVWDRRLHRGVVDVGLRVSPATLPAGQARHCCVCLFKWCCAAAAVLVRIEI